MCDISSNPEMSKDFSVGKCYRLVKPKWCNTVLKLDSVCKPGPIAPFSVPTLNPQAAAKFKAPSDALMELTTFDDVCKVSVDTPAPALVLKVVFVSTEKKARFSFFKTIKVKDISGAQHYIQLFGDIRNAVQNMTVYRFTGLLIQKFRKEGEPWGRIRSQQNTKVNPVATEMAARFAHMQDGEIEIDGVFYAHETPKIYNCCSHCKRSLYEQTGPNCQHCNTAIPSNQSTDFRIVLLVASTDVDDVLRVLVFRSQLGLPFKSYTENEIQKLLEKFHMGNCLVRYDERDRKGLTINARKVTLELTGDSGINNEQKKTEEEKIVVFSSRKLNAVFLFAFEVSMF